MTLKLLLRYNETFERVTRRVVATGVVLLMDLESSAGRRATVPRVRVFTGAHVAASHARAPKCREKLSSETSQLYK